MALWEKLADTRCLAMGLDLCFAGTCQVDDGFQFCLCDSGYGPDLFTYHMGNCVVPRYAFEVFFAMFLVLWTGVLVSFVRRVRQARSVLDARMRRISQLTLAYHITLGSILAGYLLQGGMFEVSAVFTFAFCTLLGAILTHMLVLVLNVSHERTSMQEFESAMFGAQRFFIMFNIGLSLATVPMMRSRYADLFTFTAQTSFNVVLLGVMLLARKHSNEFMMTLDVGMRFAEGGSLVKLQSLRSRVSRIQYYLGMLMAAFTVMSLLMLLRFALGTMPFYYAALAHATVLAIMVTLGMGQLLEDNATDLKVNRSGIDLAAEPSSGAEPSSSDSRHSGYIVGAYKVNTSKRRNRRRV